MGTLSVYNQSKTLQQSFQAHYKEITRIKFLAQNSSLAATVSCDSTVNIWNTSFNPWTLTASFAGSGDCFVGLAFIDADTVAVGDVGGLIQKWSIKTGQTLNSLSSGKGVFSLQLFTNNQGVTCLAAGLDSPGDINIYNLNTFTFITSLVGHSETVFDLALVSTSNLLVSSSMDLTIRLWDLTTNTCKFILQGHTSNVYGLKVISSNVLASGSDDIWNTENLAPLIISNSFTEGYIQLKVKINLQFSLTIRKKIVKNQAGLAKTYYNCENIINQ
jgi:WD40 repeat protein